MKKIVLISGIIILFIGLILLPFCYPAVGYEEAGDAVITDNYDFFSNDKTKIVGNVERIWKDEVPSDIEYSIAYLQGGSIIQLEDMDSSIFIFADRDDLSKGDRVSVKGYAQEYEGPNEDGNGDSIIITGDSFFGISLPLYGNSTPDPATVRTVPHGRFYVSIGITVMGLFMMLYSRRMKEPEKKPPPPPPPAYPYPPPPPPYGYGYPPPYGYGYPPPYPPPGPGGPGPGGPGKGGPGGPKSGSGRHPSPPKRNGDMF